MDLSALQAEIAALKKENAALKAAALGTVLTETANTSKPITAIPTVTPKPPKERLDNEEIARYSRQLLMSEIGVQGLQ